VENKEPIIISKRSFIFPAVVLFVIIAFTLLFAFFWPTVIFNQRFYQVNSFFAITLFCWLWVIWYWKHILGKANVEIYEDRIELFYLIKPQETLFFKDIIGCLPGSLFTYISFKSKTIRLSLSTDSDDKLREFMASKGFKNYENTDFTTNEGLSLFSLIFFSGIFLMLVFYIPKTIMENAKGHNLKHLYNYTLNSKPTVECNIPSCAGAGLMRNNGEIPELYFNLKNYEEFDFYFGNDTICMASRWIDDNIKIGDTINLDILQYDYDVKISRTRPPSFWDKHFRWNEIEVYRINVKGMHLQRD